MEKKEVFKLILGAIPQQKALLVGAQARDIGFDQPRNLPMRRTEDWDLLIELESWEALDKLFKGYESMGATQKINSGRVILGGLNFDLIPANLSDPNSGKMFWMGKEENGSLNMTGYKEAWATASEVRLEEHPIKVASPEALVWLKLVAWNDRRDLKHLQDCLHILRHFDTTQGEAIWDADPMPDLEQVGYEEFGAWLVGREVSKILKPSLVGLVREIVERLLKDDVLIGKLARFVSELHTEREIEVVQRLFSRFLMGCGP